MVKIVCGIIFGLIIGGIIASHVYLPQLKCVKQVSVKETKHVYPTGTFEYEVKRTE